MFDACADRLLADYYSPSGNSRHVISPRHVIGKTSKGTAGAESWFALAVYWSDAAKVFNVKSMKLLSQLAGDLRLAAVKSRPVSNTPWRLP